jgi:CDP-glucose 4,6-dehydratase
LIARLANSPAQFHGQSFNFGPDVSTRHSVEEVVCEVASHWPGSQWHVQAATDSKPEAQFLRLDCSKAQQQLEWQSGFDVPQSLRLTADWYGQFYTHFDHREMAGLTRLQIQSVAATD